MKTQKISMTLLFILFGNLLVFSQPPQTTAFNYQGNLSDAGIPANGDYQLELKLYDSLIGGNQTGNTISDVSVTATQGVFSVLLDFGAAVFTGEDRFLEIAVRRNPGENYTILNPRQQIASSPYSIRTLSAAQADVALDSNKLGGVDASEYVTSSTIGGSFIRNATTLQTGSFNIDGNGFVGGNFGIGTTSPQSKLSVQTNGYGITQTNGTVTVGSFLTTGSGWFGTRSNHPLNFFTNDGGAAMQITPSGEVGIGVTPQAGIKFDVSGVGRFQTTNGNINIGTPNTETGITFTNNNRADVRFNGSILTLAAGTGIGVPANTGVSVNTSGNVGIGTTNPTARLEVVSPGGIGGTGLRVTNTNLGGSAIVAVAGNISGNALNGTGNIFTTGNIKQNLTSNGAVKAMALITYDGTQIPTIVRCYDGVNNSTASDCGFIYGPINLGLGFGGTRINFGFTVDNRFISTTPFGSSAAGIFDFPNTTTVDIYNNYGDFYIFVF